MGADRALFPKEEEWAAALYQQIRLDYKDKMSYCTIWELDGIPAGHCNVNKIVYGSHAYMHLHLWNTSDRMKGMGSKLIRLSLPFFIQNLQLEKLYSEPYALNPAPNSALKKAGFELQDTYSCIPGTINFEQQVNLWVLSSERIHEYK
jgi:RimJ/RimL family protein N-acetyltransferase